MTDVRIFRNIVFNNWGFEIGTGFEPGNASAELAARNVVIEDNITGPFRSKQVAQSFFEIDMHGFEPENNIVADPCFIAPEQGDFSIPFTSPAAGNAAMRKGHDDAYYYGALRPGERTWLRKF
jgi:hypothetical protein